MKVTDLMIGDWIHNTYTNENYKVWRTFFSQATNYGKRLDATFEDVNIAPIPLTKELLLNNNFRVSYFGSYVYESEDGSVELDNRSSAFPGNWVCGINSDKIQRMISYADILYLHELQHLLHICNIEIDWKL